MTVSTPSPITPDPLAPGHYVNPAPFDPAGAEAMSASEERFYRASEDDMRNQEGERAKRQAS